MSEDVEPDIPEPEKDMNRLREVLDQVIQTGRPAGIRRWLRKHSPSSDSEDS